MAFTTVDGVKLYYEHRGSGYPVLLIGTAGNPGNVWAMQVPALTEHFSTITYDNRATGQSDRPEGPYSIEQMAADAAGILDELTIERAHVVGWSMGGMIAQELAISYPERVDKLVLLASLARAKPHLMLMHEVEFAPGTPRASVHAMLPWFYSTDFLTDERRVEAILNRMVPPDAKIPDAAAMKQRNDWINGAIQQYDSRDRLNEIRAETLVMVGAEDITLPMHYSEELADGIPHSEFLLLERGNHGMPVEFPADVNQALIRFLTKPARPSEPEPQ